MAAFKHNLTIQIGLILLVPVLGAFIGLVFFFDHLNQTSSDEAFVNVAGYQRLLSEKIRAQAEVIVKFEKHEYGPDLHKTILKFDHSLTVLEKGGTALGRTLPPASAEIADELNNIKKHWTMIKSALLIISELPSNQKEVLQTYNSAVMHLGQLAAASNDLVTAYEARSNAQRENVATTLLIIALINGILLVFGVWITKNYLAEKNAADEKMRRQSLIIDSIHDAVITTDLEGFIVNWNKGAERLFGYVALEVIGRHIQAIYPDEYRENVKDNILLPIKSDANTNLELPMLKKSGEKFYAEIALSQLQDDNNNITGMISYCTDITKRIHAEQEIQNQVRQQAAIAELGQHALKKTDLLTFMDVAVGLVAGVLKTDYCKILEYIPESDDFFFIAGDGWPKGLIGIAFVDGGSESQAGYTLLSDEPVIVSDFKKETRFNGPALLDDHDVVSGISIPVHVHEKPYGILGVHTKSKQNFTKNDVTFLQTVSNILSQVIERSRSENTLRHSEARFRDLVESTSDWVWEVNAQGVYTYASPQIKDLLGYSQEEILGKTPFDLMPPEEAKRVGDIFADITSRLQPIVALENTNIHKNGKRVVLETSGVPFFDDNNNYCGYRGIDRDISKRKQFERKLQNLAHYDQLTKLPNRTLFFERLQIALDKAVHSKRLVVVMFLDLDRFKLINDTLGHDAGDLLLKEVAIKLSNVVRGDDTVARLGGDEFAVILVDVAEKDDVKKVAQNILDTLETPSRINGREFFITSSIGISYSPEHSTLAKTLVAKADIAMFKAKENGRNNIQIYSSQMDIKTIERLSLETSLRKALEREEFKIFYQPKLFLSTGKMSGMESLLRWQSSPDTLVSPVEFIPLLEDTGLIIPVGEWVLYKSCQQIKKWHDAGFEKLRVSVNLSARQFRQQDLVEMIIKILNDAGLDSKYLELEITESLLMENLDQTSGALQRLFDLGIHITIDDFGTGYSSLSYLKQFPISTLKIDRSFIKDTPDDTESAALTASIIAMAKSLNINVVAEGVETEEQLKFLCEQKCDEMQGFYFSKPVPAEEFTTLLENDRCLDISQYKIKQFSSKQKKRAAT